LLLLLLLLLLLQLRCSYYIFLRSQYIQ